MTVHLVGVGPGDADLITVKAAQLLARADAVVFDRLIGDDVLDYVSPWAERYDVGKTPGTAAPAQKQINDLLIALGHRLDTVVRVKGGDPFVFGRGIEEARACEAAGHSVEIVPGVTSALAGPMAAGISVTERGQSSGVCIVTAEQDPLSRPLDWHALAHSGLTLVILMGARRASELRDRLIAAGLPADTPAGVATNATRPHQQIWRGPLADLGAKPVPSPSVLIIGSVARVTSAGPARAQRRLRSASSRRASRSASRLAMIWRLSTVLRPLPSPSSILARPSLK